MGTEEDIRLLRTAAEMIGSYICSKKFEEALRFSEERFRNLVENATDVIYSLDAKGNFSYLSPQFTKVSGYAVDECLNRPVYEKMHPEDKEQTIMWLEAGMPRGEPMPGGYQFRLQAKDGSMRWFVTNSSIIRDEEDNVVEIIGVAHDITEMRQILENLKKTNQELRDTQIQLVQSEKMASLGMLVAGVAHEINTPVGAITSMHDTLIRAINKLKTTIEKECAGGGRMGDNLMKYMSIIDEANKVIESGGERVTNIVKRLRSFARLDEAELKKADINEGIEDTLTIVHHELKHNVEVVKNYGDLPEISCYPGQLNQVFLNLFINAKQAFRDKGRLEITTYSRNRRIVVEVADNGSGIPEDKLKKIFDPGFTTKGVGVGTGLGLSICYQIIQAHHGVITVTSEVGVGTTFRITLPTNLDEILDQN
jgi:PAS domain S-box-containing protein